MNDADFLKKVRKAGDEYRLVYGEFPPKIGIHSRRSLSHHSIEFLEMPPAPVVDLQDNPAETITFTRYICPLEPAVGPKVTWDSVYLPDPNGGEVISSEKMEYMARVTLARDAERCI